MKKNTVHTEAQFAQLHRVIADFEANGLVLRGYDCCGEDEEHVVGSGILYMRRGRYGYLEDFVDVKVINRHNGTDADANIGVYVRGADGRKKCVVKIPVTCTERVYSSRLGKALAMCECFKNLHGIFF